MKIKFARRRSSLLNPRATNLLGVAASAAAAVAVAAYVYAVLLPYRLSPTQQELFDISLIIQFSGPVLAIGLGIPARRGDDRARKLASVAIAVAFATFLFAMCTAHVHSASHLVR
jgi:hypothetical protein